jgi:ketosteroid isomerase-like protein
MKEVLHLSLVVIFSILAGGCGQMAQKSDIEADRAAIKEVIHNSIGWAATKDKELSFSCFADDPELFWFSPRDDGTVHGYKAFVDLTENFFMLDDFKAVGYEIRDLAINISRSGDVAWYHARLDDFNEWRGQPANWEDVRWTGVLEKRDGRWLIVQMHFSSPTDR